MEMEMEMEMEYEDGLGDGESQFSYREHTLEEGHTAQTSYDEGK